MNVQPKKEGFVEPQPAQAQAVSPEPVPVAAPAPEPPVRREEEWPVRIKLIHKPIKNNQGELIQELVFREPTAGDLNRYGNPVRINADGDVVIDEQKMMRVIAALSGVLIPLIEAMDPRDWSGCAYRLRNFFLPETSGWL